MSHRARMRCAPAAVAVALALAAPAAHARPDAPGASLQRLVAAGAPGAILFTAQHGRSARAATGRHLSPGASFRIGSLTKTYVAAVVLQLVGERRLALDDPLARYLPGIVPGADAITVRQLLQHTSGLPDFDGLPAVTQPYLAGDLGYVWQPRALIDLAVAQPSLSRPGAAFAYSNTNYLVAGLLVEKITGRPLGAVLRERILRPLHLRHTAFALRGDAPRPQAHGYTVVPGGDRRLDVTTLTPYSWAAGAIVSTAPDVGAFYRALLAGRVLAPRLLSTMLRTVADTSPDVPGQRYGLGLVRFPTRCGPAYGHNGDTPGYLVFALTSRDGARQAVLFVDQDAESLPRTVPRVFLDVLVRSYCGTP